MFAGDRTNFRFPLSKTCAALAGTCGLMVVAGPADAATLAADVAGASGLPQAAAGYDPATMALLMLAFLTMAVAGRAVRRRTLKDIISAEKRRRTN